MTEKAPVFDDIYRDYIAEVREMDPVFYADRLGIKIDQGQIVIPFFEMEHRITETDILDPAGKRPDHVMSVILSKYILLCPEFEPAGEDLVTYKDFKDAAPFVGGFAANGERPVAETFPGCMDELEAACQKYGGTKVDLDLPYDLVVRFSALPRVPIYLLFTDADDEFPAQSVLLFERRAAGYLDMECLAMVGMKLAAFITREKK